MRERKPMVPNSDQTRIIEQDKEIEQLRDNLKRMQQWVDDLQSGMFINCVYCGHRYGPEDAMPSSLADVLKAHVATCEKHPMSGLAKAALAAAHALRSYQYGNAAPRLAEEVADYVEAAVRDLSAGPTVTRRVDQ